MQILGGPRRPLRLALIVRLAKPTCGPPNLSWRRVQTHRQAGVLHRPWFWMFQRHNIVPRPQMHIAPQILTGLHGTGWHADVLQETHGLVWGTLASPGHDEGIQRVVLEPASRRRRKAC